MPSITQKGQVTIPKEVRELLDVKQGDEVIFEVEQEKVTVRKKKKKVQFQKYVGFLKHKKEQQVDIIIRSLRDDEL